jgi:hypothetical protein
MRTPHRGLHLCLGVPRGRVMLSVTGLWPGIDTRGPGRRGGGYLVGPGFVVDGRPYVTERDTRIRELPGWLAGLVDTRVRAHSRPGARARPALPGG